MVNGEWRIANSEKELERHPGRSEAKSRDPAISRCYVLIPITYSLLAIRHSPTSLTIPECRLSLFNEGGHALALVLGAEN